MMSGWSARYKGILRRSPDITASTAATFAPIARKAASSEPGAMYVSPSNCAQPSTGAAFSSFRNTASNAQAGYGRQSPSVLHDDLTTQILAAPVPRQSPLAARPALGDPEALHVHGKRDGNKAMLSWRDARTNRRTQQDDVWCIRTMFLP